MSATSDWVSEAGFLKLFLSSIDTAAEVAVRGRVGGGHAGLQQCSGGWHIVADQ